MTSNLTLYVTRLTKERNYCLENVENYLANHTSAKAYETAFQYIKIADELDIKIPWSQEHIAPTFSYNYLKIKQSDVDAPFYYFIDSIEWVASDTIRLKASIDVLNTYSARIRGADFFGPLTRVEREHRDRFYEASGNWIPLIDRVPENMSIPMARATIKPIIDEDAGNGWAVAYYGESSDEKAPIYSVILPKTSVEIKVPSDAGSGRPYNFISQVQQGDVIYLFRDENHYPDDKKPLFHWYRAGNRYDAIIALGDEKIYDENNRAVIALAYLVRILSVTNVVNFECYAMWYYSDDLTFSHSEECGSGSADGDIFRFTYSHVARKGHYPDNFPSSIREILNLDRVTLIEGQEDFSSAYCDKLSNLKRTSLTLGKVIEIPYIPFNVTKDAQGVLSLADGFLLVRGRILSIANVPEFSRTIPFEVSKFMASRFPHYLPGEVSETALRSIENETKSLMSDFYYLKFVYDSFSYIWKLEDAGGFVPSITNSLSLNFYLNPEMLSEFFVSFSWTKVPQSKAAIKREDFPFMVAVARNNETAIYTSQYLDYLKTGYNYDQKKKSIDSTMQGWSVALNAINVVASVAGAIATQGMTTPFAVSAVTGLASSISSGAVSNSLRDQSFASNIRNLQAQGATATGISDYNLMVKYNGIPVRVMEYGIDEIYRQKVYDFLSIYGYASMGQYSPNVHTRSRWNYLKCEADLSTAAACAIPKDKRDLLMERFSEGVFFIHNRPVTGFSNLAYDFDFTLENWDLDMVS